MPKENPKIITSDGEGAIRAIVAARKTARRSFDVASERLSQVEAAFKAIYSGKQVVNHEDLILLRDKYTKLMSECQIQFNKMSEESKAEVLGVLEKFSEKKTALQSFWYVDCGPIATPINAVMSHLLKLGVSSSENAPTLSDYTRRQLEKCHEKIQGILNKRRGAITEDAIANLKAEVTECYVHYQGKILKEQPEMTNYLPNIETYFSTNDNYNRLLDQLDSRDMTAHVIREPAFKPPPPPGPSPADRRQAELKAQLKQVVGGGDEPGPSETDSKKMGNS